MPQVKKTAQRGFTLIELVLYAGLLSILVGVMGVMFGQIVDVQLESEATSGVDQDGRYILGKMIYDMKSLNTSDTIATPANPGNTSTTLQLNINSTNYTYSLDGNGNLVLTNNATGEANVLNGWQTSVSNLSFQRIGAGGSNDTIRVSFTINSRVQQHSGVESRSFQTTLAKQ
jgi:type II secretory pathway pseudopilin PulG